MQKQKEETAYSKPDPYVIQQETRYVCAFTSRNPSVFLLMCLISTVCEVKSQKDEEQCLFSWVINSSGRNFSAQKGLECRARIPESCEEVAERKRFLGEPMLGIGPQGLRRIPAGRSCLRVV